MQTLILKVSKSWFTSPSVKVTRWDVSSQALRHLAALMDRDCDGVWGDVITWVTVVTTKLLM